METRKTINQGSLEISKNSRGFTWTVKAYGDNVNEITINTTSLITEVNKIIDGLSEENKE